MAYFSKDAYDGKREWATRRMAENAEIETLTKEQHEALAYLCEVRHKVHCDQDAMWNVENADYSALWEAIGDESNSDSNIGQVFANAKLNCPPLLDSLLPSSSDWCDILSAEDREEWEMKAKETEIGLFQHDGYSLWIEEGNEYAEFTAAINKWNDDVEIYLNKIDEQYGTDYCPCGATRVY